MTEVMAIRHALVGRSELDHHLDGFTIIHRTIAIGDAIEIRGAIEHEARLDATFQHVGQ